MSSLSKSRWAPPVTRNNENQKPSSTALHDRRGLLSPTGELARFTKILARLKWKLPFLAEGYRLATLPADAGIDVSHAEIMFKLDFHEYYALLERALVHLLGVFGIAVSGAPKSQGWAGSHRYHANVLEALEGETNPLRPVLGSGERHSQLRRAKELRNRWKTADLSQEERERDEFYSKRKEGVMPLASYDLDKILSVTFDGLEDAYRLAETYAIEHDNGQKHLESSPMDWDFIVDAMDWEAV
ncbi:uncharacterized protein BJX67DRAFT_380769 [Aspergillus lucknowensis]|uniref:Uncharacterized protein n=1 Tax=Aspergillus lucknowensis TaxID=176173 RepID=A0ABR4LTF7_9EURO